MATAAHRAEMVFQDGTAYQAEEVKMHAKKMPFLVMMDTTVLRTSSLIAINERAVIQ